MVLRDSFFTSMFILALSGVCLTALFAAAPARVRPPDQFLPLTDARVAALPEAEQGIWRKYLDTSRRLAAAMPARTEPDFSPMEPLKAPLSGAKITKGLRTNADAKWYGSEEARVLADRVGAWQTVAGGLDQGH